MASLGARRRWFLIAGMVAVALILAGGSVALLHERERGSFRTTASGCGYLVDLPRALRSGGQETISEQLIPTDWRSLPLRDQHDGEVKYYGNVLGLSRFEFVPDGESPIAMERFVGAVDCAG